MCIRDSAKAKQDCVVVPKVATAIVAINMVFLLILIFFCKVKN